MQKKRVKTNVFISGTSTITGKIEPGREQFAFVHGMNRVPMMDVVKCKNELCATMGWNNRTSWYNHLYERIEPRVSEAKVIESVFAKYGVKDVWGS